MWTALIGAGLSILGGIKDKKNAKKQQGKADAAEAQRMAMLQQNMDFARGEYDSWKDRFDPIFGDLQSMADDDTVDYSGVIGDATAAYDASAASARREAQRYGLNPGDGDQGARAGLARAASIVDATNAQRMNHKDQKWDRYAQLAGMAGSGMSAATGMVSGAMGSMASAYGDQANTANANAANARANSNSALGAAGQIIGGIDWGSAMGKALPQAMSVAGPQRTNYGLSGVNVRDLNTGFG